MPAGGIRRYTRAVNPAAASIDLAPLVELIRGRTVVALTGAGCSTESGIPDYRGPGARPRTPIQYRDFLSSAAARARYWARAAIGWRHLASARPNPAHQALSELEAAGPLAGIITQNVDGLHQAAGSRAVIELHGAIDRVRCLACGEVTAYADILARVLALKLPAGRSPAAPATAPGPEGPEGSTRRSRHPRRAGAEAAAAPDGDADLALDPAAVVVPACDACGGVLKPDVVFFGENVPRATVDAAWAMFGRAEVLLVAGSSLAVFSGYRFVRRAAERGVPVAIVNLGPTRGDGDAAIKVEARLGEVLPRLVRALD